MKRSEFLYLSGLGAGALMLPNLSLFGKPIDPMDALNVVDVRIKKELADVALNAAKAKGATYADVRIGRYLKGTMDKDRIMTPSNDPCVDCYPDTDFAGLYGHEDSQDPHCALSS